MADITELADEFIKQLEERESETVERLFNAFEKSISPDFKKELSALLDEIERAKQAGEKVNPQLIYKSQRYIELISQVSYIYDEYLDEMAMMWDDERIRFFNLGLSFGQSYEQFVISGSKMVTTVDFNRVNLNSIAALAALVGEEKPLTELLDRNFGAESAVKITDALLAGIAKGDSPIKVAKEVMKALNTGAERTMLIARDQMLRAHKNGTLAHYRQSDVIIAYKRLAGRDSRVCLPCLVMDGAIFPKDESPPLHPMDRCTLIPIVAGVDPAEWETGKEWLLKQSEEYQRELMGRERYELYKNGSVSLEQMVKVGKHETWGPTVAFASVKELKAGTAVAWQAPVQNLVKVPEKPKNWKESGIGREKRLALLEAAKNAPDYDKLLQEQRNLVEELDQKRRALPRQNYVPVDMAAYDAYSEQMRVAYERMGQLHKEKAEGFSSILYPGNSGKENFRYVPGKGMKRKSKNNTETIEQVGNGISSFSNMVGDKEALKDKAIEFEFQNGTRARYQGGFGQKDVVYVGNPSKTTMIHELGHWLEEQDREIFDESQRFLRSRIESETPILFPGTGVGNRKPEYYYPNNFKAFDYDYYNNYVAKSYIWKGKPYASEIISMGLEQMYENPLYFAENDPEYFEFIIRVMYKD